MRGQNRRIVLSACLGSALMLAGCASVRSAQEPVFSTQDIMASLTSYRWPTAVEEYYSTAPNARKGLSQRNYRDLVVTLYLNAIDAQYADFRNSADAESRATALGFDLALLGLTGIAGVAEADEVGPLASAIAAFTGARSSFDKNLFFNLSLPAMFAAMDEERAKARLVLVEGMQRDAQGYPLPLALGHLGAYQRAGSFSLAISKVTRQAVTNKNEAEARLEQAIAGCDIVEDVQESTKQLRTILDSTNDDDPAVAASKRDALAAQFKGLRAGLSRDELRDQIGAVLNNAYCRTSERAAKLAEIQSKLENP